MYAIDPSQRFAVVLASDLSRPLDEQPRLIFRYLSGREFREVVAQYDGLPDVGAGAKGCDAVYEALRRGLVGWERVKGTGGPIPFDPARLDEVTTFGEALEVLREVIRRNAGPGADERKNSGSPSPTGSAASAGDAPPASAAAAPAVSSRS